MQNSNRNRSKSSYTIFTLVAFILGFVLYIILKQTKEDEEEEIRTKKILVPPIKKIPKKANEIEDIGKDIKLSNRQKKIVKELIAKKKMYPSELQELLPDVSARTVRRDMNDLEKQGLVKQIGTTKSTHYVYIGN